MGRIMNLDQINIIKRQKVKQGLEFVDRMNQIDPVISRIVIFGSAVSNECGNDSDIDLCIFSQYDNKNKVYRSVRGRLMDQIDDVCDIIRYDTLNDHFKEVVEDGVTVYEL